LTRSSVHIFSLSLHDALPIFRDLEVLREVRPVDLGNLLHDLRLAEERDEVVDPLGQLRAGTHQRVVGSLLRSDLARDRLRAPSPDRKSTRLNSSHVSISYAVF